MSIRSAVLAGRKCVTDRLTDTSRYGIISRNRPGRISCIRCGSLTAGSDGTADWPTVDRKRIIRLEYRVVGYVAPSAETMTHDSISVGQLKLIDRGSSVGCGVASRKQIWDPERCARCRKWPNDCIFNDDIYVLWLLFFFSLSFSVTSLSTRVR